MNNVIEALAKRRSHHKVERPLPLPMDDVVNLIKDAVRLTPSAFNSQGSRIVILLGAEHEKLWDLTKQTLRPLVPQENFHSTEAKIDGFAAGAGTILFYEDLVLVSQLQERFPLYSQGFPVWAEQSNGMVQLAVWLALSEAGIGASLQHYNPLIDAEVADLWGVNPAWCLRAQMPFGSPSNISRVKEFIDANIRVKTFE